jgi:hypothetical protein
MFPVRGLESNNNSVVKEFRNDTRIREHDFISIRTQGVKAHFILWLNIDIKETSRKDLV